MAFDMSVINVALPDIQESLNFSDAGLSWVVNAYALASWGAVRSRPGPAPDGPRTESRRNRTRPCRPP
ncbi:hypothetical protein ABZ589_38585, partial [Streptomyces sp. NPDC013313]|uniref:hypothetical protein n=1 Tax=Streptomyces sp. NPDC013313 TaxID=3155603 RepID=UPI0033C45D59